VLARSIAIIRFFHVPAPRRFPVGPRRQIMRRKAIKRLPFFPLIPAVPIALIAASLATAIRALVRVSRLEQRVAGAAAA
jgi:hypothetical protein